MTKLRPLSLTTTQIERLKKEEIGSGFFAYRYDNDTVTLVAFKVGKNGELTYPDGSPFEYFCKNGDIIRFTWKSTIRKKRNGTIPSSRT